MAFVSSKKLSRDVLSRIRYQLVELLLQQKTRKEVAQLVDELLTDTERLLLAKRVVLIIMLHNKCSYYEIHETLGVSTDTAARWHQALRAGELASIEKTLKRKGARDQLCDTIEVILRSGMPPIAARNRYSRTFKIIDEVRARKNW
jgi:uncharacterized protein YerC